MFSKTTEYALRAAVYLASSNEPSTAQRIAAATHVPVGYMAKVLSALVRSGMVLSQRGPTGGFVLARHADQVSALDIVAAVEPIPRIRTCPISLREHQTALCPLHSMLDRLAEFAEDQLGRTTLADLLRQPLTPLGRPGLCLIPQPTAAATPKKTPGHVHGASI